jgi:hypothetical protein
MNCSPCLTSCSACFTVLLPSLRVFVQAAKGFRSGCPDLVPFCHDLLRFLPITPGLFIEQLAIAPLNGVWVRVVNAQAHDLRDLEPYFGE